MYAKLLIVSVTMMVIAATLLVWRQQRLELSHETMSMHREIRQTRQAIWQQQADAAWLLTPHRLRESLNRSQIAMEPAIPLNGNGTATHVADAQDNPISESVSRAVMFPRTP